MFPLRAPFFRQRGEPPGSPHPSPLRRRHDGRQDGSGARGRAGGRPRARPGGASRSAGGSRWAGSSWAPSSASRSRLPGAPSGGRRRSSTWASPSPRSAGPDPEPRDEPAHGRGDHALRVRAPGRVEGERRPRLQAALVGVDEGADGGRPAARDQPAHGDRGQGRRQAEGRARRPGALDARGRGRVRVRHREGRGSSRARSPSAGRSSPPSSRGSRPHSASRTR